MKPPQDIDSLFEEFVQELPADYEALAHEFKAFVRARKIRSVAHLLHLVLLYCGLDLSLRGCAAQLAQSQGYLSDTAVKQRLEACVPWAKAMLIEVFGLRTVVESGQLRFIVIDGSTVQVPGATGTSYRLHIALDLVALTLRQVEVSTDKVGESLDHYVLQEGDVVLIDRGYNQPKSLVPFIDRGGDVVVRYNAQGMNLYRQDEAMEKIDWPKRLRELDGHAGAIPVYLCHDQHRLEGTVHAIPLPPEKAAEARRRVQQRACKKGRRARAASLFLSGWVLIFTSVPVTLLDTAAIGSLYQVRWQVELAIKKLKSLLDIDRLRARKDSPLAELYLYGKLLYAAVLEKLVARRFGSDGCELSGPRRQTPWRLWQLVANALRSQLVAMFPLRKAHIDECLKSLRERPRKRPLQTLPVPVLELLQRCRRLGVSAV